MQFIHHITFRMLQAKPSTHVRPETRNESSPILTHNVLNMAILILFPAIRLLDKKGRRE